MPYKGRNSQRNSRKRSGYTKQELQNRKGNMLSPTTKSFVYGVGVGLLAAVLFPQLKDSVRPLSAGAIKGVSNLADKIQETFVELKENVQDIVAEAKFENLKNSIEKDIIGEIVDLGDVKNNG